MFGKFLKRRLTELDMSYSDLERELNLAGYKVTRSNIAHWISGRNKPNLGDPDFIRLLARVLQMSVANLLEQLDFITTGQNETVGRIADIAARLSKDKQDLALQFVEMLARNAESGNGK